MSKLTESDFAALGEQVDVAVDKLDRRRSENGWHLKKEISVSVIISVVGIAIAGMTAYSDLKQEIALIQSDVSSLHKVDSETRETIKDIANRFTITVEKMDAKLDRLIERGKV